MYDDNAVQVELTTGKPVLFLLGEQPINEPPIYHPAFVAAVFGLAHDRA